MWEANNVLTNFDPVNKAMVDREGRIDRRSRAGRSRRNNFGPRLGFAYTVAPKTVVRGGWGISYVHINRIGSANLLGDQRSAGRARRRGAGRRDRGDVPTDRAGLSGGPDRLRRRSIR